MTNFVNVRMYQGLFAALCMTAAAGDATRECTANGTWLDPDVSGCLGLEFEEALQVCPRGGEELIRGVHVVRGWGWAWLEGGIGIEGGRIDSTATWTGWVWIMWITEISHLTHCE